MKKGDLVYFKNKRLIDWETEVRLDLNRLYTIVFCGMHYGKECVTVYGNGSVAHKDHFVKADTTLLDIPVFEIGDMVEYMISTPMLGSHQSFSETDMHIKAYLEDLIIGKRYKVLEYNIYFGVVYIQIQGNTSRQDYYILAKHFKK